MATRLLLADDSITIQKVVELVLAEEGFEIKAVGNGEEAFQLMASFRPDIVLADIEMPKMNGYQLCERIKSSPSTAGIPVILLAGAFEPVDEELVKKVGADDYIIKPFESQDLLNKISAALKGFVAGAEPAEEEPAEAAVAEEDLWAVEGLAEQTEEAVQALEDEATAEAAYSIPEETFVEEAFTLAEEAATETIEEAATAYVAEEEEEPAAHPVSAAEIAMAVQSSISRSVSDALGRIDFKEAIVSALMPEIRAVADRAVRESAAQIIQSLVSEVAREAAAGMKKDIEKVIWETVPDLAESAIRKEIEAIKSEL
jgi:CheY-like chemotaxis protein